MNERAREVLIEAAMQGVPQIKGKLRDGYGGFCAGGVLIKAYLEEQGLAWSIFSWGQPVLVHYDMSNEEWEDMVDANNNLDWDFLTIARKIGVPREEVEFERS